jgi:hypothetical protein
MLIAYVFTEQPDNRMAAMSGAALHQALACFASIGISFEGE